MARRVNNGSVMKNFETIESTDLRNVSGGFGCSGSNFTNFTIQRVTRVVHPGGSVSVYSGNGQNITRMSGSATAGR